jgi:transposase-like protein
MAGRPSKLNEEIFKQILEYVEKGAYVEVACRAVGVHKTTLYDWAKRGQADIEAGNCDTLYARIAEELPRRAAILEIKLGEALVNAALNKKSAGNHQAILELLARQHPERWSKKIEIESKTTVTHAFAYEENASILSRGAATRAFVDGEILEHPVLPEGIHESVSGSADVRSADSGTEEASVAEGS